MIEAKPLAVGDPKITNLVRRRQNGILFYVAGPDSDLGILHHGNAVRDTREILDRVIGLAMPAACVDVDLERETGGTKTGLIEASTFADISESLGGIVGDVAGLLRADEQERPFDKDQPDGWMLDPVGGRIVYRYISDQVLQMVGAKPAPQSAGN